MTCPWLRKRSSLPGSAFIEILRAQIDGQSQLAMRMYADHLEGETAWITAPRQVQRWLSAPSGVAEQAA